MFEESCLTCGKTLVDDSWRAYCSNQCMPSAPVSPSSSSLSSSTYSSPKLFPTHPKKGHIPALSRAALGGSAKCYDAYTASSSASSTSWSADTTDEEKINDVDDSGITPSSFQHISKAGIYYARRPSATANLPTVPLLHTRSSLGTTPSDSTPYPQSAPHGSAFLNSARSGRKSSGYPTPDSGTSSVDGDIDQNTAKAKRNRNRVSLPAYFSLMKMGHASKEDVTGVGSPTTHQLSSLCSPAPTLTSVVALPGSADSKSSLVGLSRGRRREVGAPRMHIQNSPPRFSPHTQREHRIAYAHQNSVEKVSEWSHTMIPLPRSPAQHVILSSDGLQRHIGGHHSKERKPSPRRSSRGRTQIDELEGLGMTDDAPGYGRGRSGLLKRERRAESHRHRS